MQNSWKLLSPMKTARTGLGVAAVAGVIYAVGGRNDSGYRYLILQILVEQHV